METLSPGQEIRPFEAMPDPRMLPFGQAKNTAIWMETLSYKQALHIFEVLPKPRILPFL